MKRFFCGNVGGARYYVVAEDLSQAKQTLHREVGFDEGDVFTWSEMREDAAQRFPVWLGDAGTPPRVMLATCELGDWFSTEY